MSRHPTGTRQHCYDSSRPPLLPLLLPGTPPRRPQQPHVLRIVPSPHKWHPRPRVSCSPGYRHTSSPGGPCLPCKSSVVACGGQCEQVGGRGATPSTPSRNTSPAPPTTQTTPPQRPPCPRANEKRTSGRGSAPPPYTPTTLRRWMQTTHPEPWAIGHPPASPSPNRQGTGRRQSKGKSHGKGARKRAGWEEHTHWEGGSRNRAPQGRGTPTHNTPTSRNLHTTPSGTLLNPLLKQSNRPPTLFQSYGAFQIFPGFKK